MFLPFVTTRLFNCNDRLIKVVVRACYHSHSVKNGLETHEKGIVVCFYDVFFVGMCTLVRSRHMGKPNLNNACLF